MSNELIPIPYTLPTTSDNELVAIKSRLNFEMTIDLIISGIERENLWVIQEINPQMLALRGGYEIQPMRQIYFFHPRLLEVVLSENPSGLLEIPFKLIISELGNGSTMVYHKPLPEAFKPWPELEPLGIILGTHVRNILARLA